MNSCIVDGVTYSRGSEIMVLSGIDRGKRGTIDSIYMAENIISISVKYGEGVYSMYQISEVELL